MHHQHKVNETRVRSLVKTCSSRAIEVLVDTLFIGSLFTLLGIANPFEWGLVSSLVIEFLCSLTNYLNERLWNKIQWGRGVEDIEEDKANGIGNF